MTSWRLARKPVPAVSMALVTALALAGSISSAAQGFSLFGSSPVFSGWQVDVQATLEQACRWSAEPVAGTGLHARIQVGVERGFARSLGAVTPREEELVQNAVVAAFTAWENPVLSFDVAFDAAVAPGPRAGLEIDLFAVPGPVGLDQYFGSAEIHSVFVIERLLTNGQRSDGCVITGGEIEINQDNIQFFLSSYPLAEDLKLAALQRLIMHEIGHTLGLGHPTIDPYNFDTDLDPLNEMLFDPSDPFSALIVSPNADFDAIMSGLNYGASLAGLFLTELRNDERGGRDALYPLPAAVTAVEIDIKPKSDRNAFDLKNKGVIPVAILSSEAFDALTVDADRVVFGPGEAVKRHKRAHVRDVDRDGDPDLLLHFRARAAGMAPGATLACLTGETYEGMAIRGCDTVTSMPWK